MHVFCGDFIILEPTFFDVKILQSNFTTVYLVFFWSFVDSMIHSFAEFCKIFIFYGLVDDTF